MAIEKNAAVALAECREYDAEVILRRLREMAASIGFDRKRIEGKRVVLKPNLLLGYVPEKAATTHPALVEAAAKLMLSFGAGSVMIAESPGGIYSKGNLDRIYGITGMKLAAELAGVPLNYDLSYREFPTPEGRASKTVNAITPICEAEVIVNLCKMKTHSLAVMTGAAKNLFGIIPGIMKFEMHARFKKPADFFSMLMDLNGELARGKTLLHIMDGIVGMEGDGPSGGTPKEAGVLLMSENPFNLDMTAAEIMGLTGRVPLLAGAAERDFCPASVGEIPLAGAPLAAFTGDPFVPPDTAKGKKFDKIPPFLQPRPVIDRKVCRGCGLCIRSCPRNTIRMKDGKAFIDRARCIRCYCCQELCTFKAVKVKKSLIYRFLE